MSSLLYHHNSHSLFAEGRVTSNGVILSDNAPKLFIVEDMILGFVGVYSEAVRVCEAILFDKPLPPHVKDYDTLVLMLTKNKLQIRQYPTQDFVTINYGSNVAEGSGSEIMSGAMCVTDDPYKIIGAAIEKAIYSGGRVMRGWFTEEGIPKIGYPDN